MASISLIAVVVVFACAFEAQARSFRVSQIPNGSVNSCSNCHVNPGGGGSRNAFGQAVEAGLISSNVDWGSALATLDSDGDGFTNGQELQDPNGTWQTGQSAPGNASLVFKPGSASSLPPATNSNPTLTSVGNKNVNEGDILSFTLSASDPNGDSVSFSASNLPSGASLSGTAFTWTPGFSQSGSYTVTFTTSDGEGGTNSESISISVTDVNQDPQLSTIGDRTGMKMRHSVSLYLRPMLTAIRWLFPPSICQQAPRFPIISSPGHPTSTRLARTRFHSPQATARKASRSSSKT